MMPASAAYPDVIYDDQRDLFFSEVDPALHAAVAGGTFTGSTLDYNPKYFLLQSYDVAGVPEDVTIDARNLPPIFIDSGLAVGDRVLLRMYNMGLRELAPMLISYHFDLVAEGGKKYPFARTQYQTLLMPGSTKDAIFTPDVEGDVKLIERRLSVTDPGTVGSISGGMQTYFSVAAVGATCAYDLDSRCRGTEMSMAWISMRSLPAGLLRRTLRPLPVSLGEPTAPYSKLIGHTGLLPGICYGRRTVNVK